MYPPVIHRGRSARASFVLVSTLILLVLAAVIVLAYISTMQIERRAQANQSSKVMNDYLTKAASAHAIALLAQNIPPAYRASPTVAAMSLTNWWVNPGRLTTQIGGGAPQHIPLYTTNSAARGQFNLNQTLSDGTYPIEPTGTPLLVDWIEVPRNPSIPIQPYEKQPNYNPVTGRYAFWIDDENSKVNWSIALGQTGNLNVPDTTASANLYGTPSTSLRGYDYSGLFWGGLPCLGTPQTIDLGLVKDASTLLDFSHLFNFFAWRRQYDKYAKSNFVFPGLYSTSAPEQILGYCQSTASDTSKTSFWNENRFVLTDHSYSPEFSCLGYPRLYNSDLSPASPAFDHLFPPSYSLTLSSAIPNSVSTYPEAIYIHDFSTAPSAVFNNIYKNVAFDLAQQWPGQTESFAQKWSLPPSTASLGFREADQVALNLLSNCVEGQLGPTYYQSFRSLHNGYSNTQQVSQSTTQGPLSGGHFLPAFHTPVVTAVGLRFTPISVDSLTPLTPGFDPVSGNTLSYDNANGNNYLIQIDLLVEEYVPKGYSPLGNPLTALNFHGLYLSYTRDGQNVTAALNPSLSGASSQDNPLYFEAFGSGYAKYMSFVNSSATPTMINPGSYLVIVSAGTLSPYHTWTLNQQGFGTSTVYSAPQFYYDNDSQIAIPAPPSGTHELWPFHLYPSGHVASFTNIEIKLATETGQQFFQILPMRQSPNYSPPGFDPPTGTDPGYIKLPDVQVTCDSVTGPVVSSSEIEDPVLGGLSYKWTSVAPGNDMDQDDLTPAPGQSTPGIRNSNLPLYPANLGYGDESKYFRTYSDPSFGFPYLASVPFQSVGLLSGTHTGMQRGLEFSTLNLGPGQTSGPPDYLMLDLFAIRNNALQIDHSTPGLININSKIYPATFNVSRNLALQAVFNQISVGGAAINAANVANAVATAEPSDGYAYSETAFEQLLTSEVASTADCQYGKEVLARNLASLFTTKSNTFRIWGVSQTVKPNPIFPTSPSNYTVTSQNRFSATIDRAVWQGQDNAYGNGYFDPSSGTYSKAGSADTTRLGQNGNIVLPGDIHDTVDGPDPVDPLFPTIPYSSTSIEKAYNPVLPYFIYKITSYDTIHD